MCIRDRDNTTPSEPSSVVESLEDRVRGRTLRLENGSLQILMEFIRQQYKKREENIIEILDKQFEKQEERDKLFIEKLDKQLEKQLERSNKLISETLDKQLEKLDKSLDNYTKEFTLFRTEIRGYTNALKADSSEAQKKQEEVVNENYEDVRKLSLIHI